MFLDGLKEWHMIKTGKFILSLILIVILIFCVSYLNRRTILKIIKKNQTVTNILVKVRFIFEYNINTIENILTVKEENLESTKLPVYSLRVKLDKLDHLNSNLPESGRQSVKGDFIYDDKIYPVKIRYRGDMYWHWGGIQKSLRISALQGKTFGDGRSSLNLVNPEREVIDENLEYWLADKMGILAPKSRPIHLRLNNKYMGVYSDVEQVNECFIKNHGLEKGNIYDGDQGVMPYEKYENLWCQTKQGWRKIVSFNDINDISELTKLIQILNENDGIDFKEKIENIVDVDKFLTYIAFLDIGSCEHIDNVHNVKLYFKPSNEKFEPVAWDTSGHWIDERAELIWERSKNDFFIKLLSIPDFRERKNKILWEHLNSVASTDSQIKYIDEQYQLIRDDIYTDKYKDTYNYYMPITNSGFDKRVEWLKKWVENRNKLIFDVLNDSKLYVFDRADIKDSSVIKKLEFVLTGESGVLLKNITIPFDCINNEETLFELWYDENRNGALDKGDLLLSVSKGKVDFQVKKTIVAGIEIVQPRGYTRADYKWIDLVPKIQPTSFNFFIKASNADINTKPVSITLGALSNDSITAENSVTGIKSEIIFSKEQYGSLPLNEKKDCHIKVVKCSDESFNF